MAAPPSSQLLNIEAPYPENSIFSTGTFGLSPPNLNSLLKIFLTVCPRVLPLTGRAKNDVLSCPFRGTPKSCVLTVSSSCSVHPSNDPLWSGRSEERRVG